MDAIVDGSYTVTQTLSAIQYQERLGYQLTALAHGPEKAMLSGGETTVNYASFIDLEVPGAQPKEIDLVAVTDPPGASSLIASKLAQGWGLIVVSTIFVRGKLASVAAFRKL